MIMDKIPVENINPHMVDDQMKAVEHRLRHDAQIFQEEADSGRRPILPGSFLQTGEAPEMPEEDDDNDDNPVKKSFDQMASFRKEIRKDRAELERDDEKFVEGNKRAKAQLAAFQAEAEQQPKRPRFHPSSLLE